MHVELNRILNYDNRIISPWVLRWRNVVTECMGCWCDLIICGFSSHIIIGLYPKKMHSKTDT